MGKVDLKKLFGTSVKARRNLLGISQEELADRADLHRTYVCDIENGARNVSLENIAKLARALEISVPALFLSSDGSPAKPGNDGKECVDILLVEDNPDDVEMTLFAFKKARFANHVQVARDGAEALDYLFRRGAYAERVVTDRPQIVLLDLHLPKVNGLEVLRRLKANKITRDIPVIVLTMSQKNQDMTECLRLGANTYIVKPVDFHRLSQATPRLNLNWALLKPSETISNEAPEVSH